MPRGSRVTTILLVASLTATSLLATSSAQGSASVSGKLVDADTLAALADAFVSIGGVSGSTAGDGSFTLTGVPSGTQTFTASKDAYEPHSRSLEVKDNGVYNLGTIALTPKPPTATVKGVVTAEETGGAIAGASVRLEGAAALTASTDGAGAFSFAGVAPGTWTLRVTKPGYVDHSSSRAITAPETNVGTIVLATIAPAPPTTATVTGRVLSDATGSPLGGALVRLALAGAARETTTGADGRFTLASVNPGTWNLTVQLAGYATHATSRVVSLPTTDLGDVRLRGAGARVTGVVVSNATGAPVADARVSIATATGGASGSTGADGRFAIDGAPDGAAGIVVSHGRHLPLSIARTVAAPATDLGTLRLDAARFESEGAFAGRVVDNATRAPIAGAVVAVAARVLETDAFGHFAMSGSSGTYALRVSRAGYTPLSTFVVVTAGTSEWREIALDAATLDPGELVLSGRIVDNATGFPIVGARANVWRVAPGGSLASGDGSHVEVIADSTGAFEVPGLAPGRSLVEAGASGYVARTVNRDFPAGRVDLGTFALDRPYTGDSTVRGRVVDNATRSPLAGATVTLGVGLSPRVITTGADGTFAWTGSSGSYPLRVAKSGYAPVDTFVSATRALVDLGDVALDAAAPDATRGRVTGRVAEDPTGAPVIGARVDLFPLTSRADAVTTVTDGEAGFDVPGLTPGRWRVEAGRSGHEPAIVELDVLAGSIVDAGTLRIRAAYAGPVALAGRVVDATTGAPLASVGVSTSGIPRGTSGADGAFRIELGSPGSYPIAFAKDGYTRLEITYRFDAPDGTLGDVRLAPSGTPMGTITGTVRAAESGLGLAGATVRVASGAITVPATTTASGAFYATGVPPGPVTVTASAPGRADGTASGIALGAGTVSVGNLMLPIERASEPAPAPADAEPAGATAPAGADTPGAGGAIALAAGAVAALATRRLRRGP